MRKEALAGVADTTSEDFFILGSLFSPSLCTSSLVSNPLSLMMALVPQCSPGYLIRSIPFGTEVPSRTQTCERFSPEDQESNLLYSLFVLFT